MWLEAIMVEQRSAAELTHMIVRTARLITPTLLL